MKRATTAPKVIRAVGQLHKNMAATDKRQPSRLSHLLKYCECVQRDGRRISVRFQDSKRHRTIDSL